MYEGMSVQQIIDTMYSHGFTQEGVNRVYEMRGLGPAPTLPASFIGGHVGGKGSILVGANGKPIKTPEARSFLNTFGNTAVDPYRERSGISNVAGGILNTVGSYVGGPVWTAMTAAADAGNKALGNDDGTSYTDGKRSSTDRIGAAVGAIAGSTNAPGSYGANNAPSNNQDLGVFSNGGRGGMSEVGVGNAGRLAASGAISGGAGIGEGGSMGATSGASSSGGWVDNLIDIGATLAGDYLAGDAAKDAGKTQAAAAAAAIAEQRRQYDLNRADLAPYREAGTTAIGQLGAGTADGADFNRDFTMADFTKDPGYQFRMDEGTHALEGSAAARGGLLSGRAGKELERYGQDYASGEYSNAYNRFNADRTTRFNRLATVAGVGQTATNTGISAGSNSTNSIADLTLERANAQAAGRIGEGNAYRQGLDSLADFYRTRKYGGANTNWIGG